MKIKPDKHIADKRLIEDLRAEAKKLRENNTQEYHAVLMELAADTITKLIIK